MLPLWKVPALAPLIPRQRKALQAVSLIRQTTEELIAKCKQMVDAEEQASPASCSSSTACVTCIVKAMLHHCSDLRVVFPERAVSSSLALRPILSVCFGTARWSGMPCPLAVPKQTDKDGMVLRPRNSTPSFQRKRLAQWLFSTVISTAGGAGMSV